MVLPKAIEIREDGPREGFQFEKQIVPTAAKVSLIDALSASGLKHIQCVSFVDPRRVPGWADAAEVMAAVKKPAGVRLGALWLNARGFEAALATGNVSIEPLLAMSASEPFAARNTGRDRAAEISSCINLARVYAANGFAVSRVSIMAAFGCNFMGDVPLEAVLSTVSSLLDIAKAHAPSTTPPLISLADTMGWATPSTIRTVVGAVRDRWPEHPISLHLHDTRGLAIANAWVGLEMGVANYDASVGGLGGCPFAANRSAAGNICTEDLVFLCEELGIDTGANLDALIEAARVAQEAVGHPLPGRIKDAGTIREARAKVLAS